MDKLPPPPNHTIDPKTGFIESTAYPYAFTGDKKQRFIDCLVKNGLGFYDACKAMGLSHHTLFNHYNNDPVFKEALDTARYEYGARLDALSKRNALKPRSVIERIFQLKSIFPERYADRKNVQDVNVSIKIDSKLISEMKRKVEIQEGQILSEEQVALASDRKHLNLNCNASNI